MRIVSAAAALILALTAAAQDKVHAPARAKSAIEKVRTQKSLRTRFEAVIKIPDSDEMKLSGESLQVAGGILFIDYRASGGETRRIVRVADKVWVYHELAEEWIPAAEVGMNGAGRGIQNPDEVLAVLASHLDGASAGKPASVDGRPCDVVDVRLSGDDIEKIMKEQAQQGSFDWKSSSATGSLFIAADGLVYRLSSAADLVSSDPNLKGQKVHYSADVSVAAYNDRFTMTFQVEDPKTRAKTDLPLDPDIHAAIAAQPGIPRELADEIARGRDAAIARLVADLGSSDFASREASGETLKRWGRAALPALKKALDDKDRAEAAKKIIAEIGG